MVNGARAGIQTADHMALPTGLLPLVISVRAGARRQGVVLPQELGTNMSEV